MRAFLRRRRRECRRCCRRRWVRMVRFERPPGWYPLGPGLLCVPGYWTLLCGSCIRWYRRTGLFPADGVLPLGRPFPASVLPDTWVTYDEMKNWSDRG